METIQFPTEERKLDMGTVGIHCHAVGSAVTVSAMADLCGGMKHGEIIVKNKTKK